MSSILRLSITENRGATGGQIAITEINICYKTSYSSSFTYCTNDTSNNIFSSSIIKSSVMHPDYPWQYAFDRNNMTQWSTLNSTNPIWLQISLPYKVRIISYTITRGEVDIQSPKTFTFDVRNIRRNWTTIDNRMNTNFTNSISKTFMISTNDCTNEDNSWKIKFFAFGGSVNVVSIEGDVMIRLSTYTGSTNNYFALSSIVAGTQGPVELVSIPVNLYPTFTSPLTVILRSKNQGYDVSFGVITYTYVYKTPRVAVSQIEFEGPIDIGSCLRPTKFKFSCKSQDIGQGFCSCKSLTAGYQLAFETSVTTISPSAYVNCTALLSLSIPTSITVIPANAFKGCSRLGSVSLPPTLTKIENNAFDSCDSLTAIAIPPLVTFLGDYSFVWNWNLSSIVIPPSVTFIGFMAFTGCPIRCLIWDPFVERSYMNAYDWDPDKPKATAYLFNSKDLGNIDACSAPTSQPTSRPSSRPSSQPSMKPSRQPSTQPSRQPTSQPSLQPTRQPSTQPSTVPSRQPSTKPTSQPSSQPSVKPSRQPSTKPSSQPSCQPSCQPSIQPSSKPSSQPTSQPSSQAATGILF